MFCILFCTCIIFHEKLKLNIYICIYIRYIYKDDNRNKQLKNTKTKISKSKKRGEDIIGRNNVQILDIILDGWAGMKWKLLIQYHSIN